MTIRKAASALLAVAFLAFPGCAKKGASSDAPIEFTGAKLDGAGSLVLEFIPRQGGPALFPIADASVSRTTAPRAPWTRAVHARGFALMGDALACAVNGLGVIVFKHDGAGGFSRELINDPVAFSGRTVSSVWTDENRAYFFLAANDTFGPAESSSSLLSLGAGETSFREEAFPFIAKYPQPWKIVSVDPQASPALRFQLVREPGEGEDRAQEAYVEMEKDGSWKEIPSTVYLSAWNPARSERMPVLALGIVEPGPILARYGRKPDEAFLALNLREAPYFAPRCYSISGDPSALFTAEAHAWADASIALAVYPGGDVRFRTADEPDGFRSAALPALAPGFDYGDCAVLGNYFFAAWAESVYPDIGRAGISIIKR